MSYFPRVDLTAIYTDLNSDQIDRCIEAGCADVDSACAMLYRTPFTSYVASPAATPPWPVRTAALYFARFHAEHERGSLNDLTDDGSTSMRYRNAALAILEPFIGNIDHAPWQELAPETVTDTLYAASWGDGIPYSTSDAKLSVVNGEIVAGTARITDKSGGVTDYQLGIDFNIWYHEPTRAWVLTRANANIGSQAASADGDKVVYEVTRLRKREIVSPGPDSVPLERA